jgi:hypothetical protein
MRQPIGRLAKGKEERKSAPSQGGRDDFDGSIAVVGGEGGESHTEQGEEEWSHGW